MTLERMSEAEATCRLRHVVFALRNAPPWAALDVAVRSGKTVDPASYAPQSPVPGFPPDIVSCIDAWNETFRVNFFRIRAGLAEIARRSRDANREATTIRSESVASLTDMASLTAHAAVFFCDDDDWFCPDLVQRLASLSWLLPKIKVFPMLRLGREAFTVARENEPCRIVVGTRRRFLFRFQTNNYGIPIHPVLVQHLGLLVDHIRGSAEADRLGLADEYVDIIISATNKTPCSASVIPSLVKDRARFIGFVEQYVESMRRLQFDVETEWCAGPAAESARLFEAALG